MTGKRSVTRCTAVFFFALLTGCASVHPDFPHNEFQADTPILVRGVAYQINTTACAQIRAVDKNGALDCYDVQGRQSASITPVGSFRQYLVKNELGLIWGSPEHQAFVFDYFYGGGKQRAQQAIMGSVQGVYGAYASTKSMLNMIDKSKAIDAQSAQQKAIGVAAYMSGGWPAWHAHQMNLAQWHLQNAQYFINESTKPTALDLK